jgi:hypothetical protein
LYIDDFAILIALQHLAPTNFAKGVRVILLIPIINQFTFIQKCEVYIRKRGALSPDSEWRSKKYNPMFVPTLMSDK